MDLISVIVPVYKVEPYLDRCVASIVGQTYRDLEIILVDDGSPDRCPEMCDLWAQKDARIKVIHKKNGGLSDARNAGLQAAKGDYIGFVDSDDWIDSEMYTRLMEAIASDQSDIACCAVEMIWDDGRPRRYLAEPIRCVLSCEEAQTALLREDKMKHPVWCRLYRVETMVPFEVGKYHEDVFWSYQVIGKANRVSLISAPLYFYRQRDDSIMGRSYSLKRLDAIEAACCRCDYMRRYYPNLAALALTSLWQSCLYNGLMAVSYLDKKEADMAFDYMAEVVHRYPIRRRDYRSLRPSERLWLSMARLSLRTTCTVKMLLKTGY